MYEHCLIDRTLLALGDDHLNPPAENPAIPPFIYRAKTYFKVSLGAGWDGSLQEPCSQQLTRQWNCDGDGHLPYQRRSDMSPR